MYEERDLLPLSALQHFQFCPRQCALIHLEGQWLENRWTAEGRVLHERVHAPGEKGRGGVREVRALPLRSLALGLAGEADVVEFHRQEGGGWRPFPVEYKRGRAKHDDWDRVQLCAQAIALEEMTGQEIREGALFYGQTRRRLPVVFDHALRHATAVAARELHAMMAAGVTPPPVTDDRCERCSLVEVCLPRVLGRGKVASHWRTLLEDEP